MFENTGGWSKKKALAKAKGYKFLVVIDKCVLVTPNIKLHSLYLQSKSNICTFNIHNNKVLCLLMHVLAELCHLQGDYTLVFETH